MEVTITQLRRNLFALVDDASTGTEVWFTHKGKRFRILPEEKPASRFSRITPLNIVNPETLEQDELRMKRAIEDAWDKNWDKFLCEP